MKVLIVAKTRMTGHVCVGGLVIDTGESIRLLRPDGSNQPMDTGYEIGQIWDLDFQPHLETTPPHVEDVHVYKRLPLSQVSDLQHYLLQQVNPWQGSPDHLFDGLLQNTTNGSGYISRRIGIPGCSTGFWIPDRSLRMVSGGDNRIFYWYSRAHGVRRLRYVGLAPAISEIPIGTLARVSLARWWQPETNPDVEHRCYLQISGWFL